MYAKKEPVKGREELVVVSVERKKGGNNIIKMAMSCMS